MLNPRQRRLYRNRVDLFRPVLTRNAATGLLETKAYVLAESGVRCLFGKLPSTSSPTAIGRGEADNMFTHDEIHFHQRQVIRENWVIRDVSVDRYGRNALSYGDFWIAIGEPLTWGDYGGRRAGYVSVRANRHKTPHPSITALLAA